MQHPTWSYQDRRLNDRIERSERLNFEESELLFQSDCDLHRLGQWADHVKKRWHSDTVYYNRNVHLNPTNICRIRCPLCAFSRDPHDPDAYLMTHDEAVAHARRLIYGETISETLGATASRFPRATELHIVGGIHPELSYGWYRELIRRLHESCPEVLIKAWTAAEIYYFAQSMRQTIETILRDLQSVGLTMLPGGGAEIFAPAIRQQISPNKIDADCWLEVHRVAHQLGMKTTATILFGHIESAADRVDHLFRLRALQDETHGFVGLVPLAFHPHGTRLADRVATRPDAAESLRMIAAARLILDNVPHIKAYWISLGVATAQLALGYGADDLDGTVCEEKIHHDAGSTSPQSLSVAQIERLIRETGGTPCERNSRYEKIGGIG
ncbi:MAG: aminofutalosine synthase MqnE [Thermoguttaceae bacterium]|nr:aminofutalosine synthase MqnE [Thermoguttaceae bacterium]